MRFKKQQIIFSPKESQVLITTFTRYSTITKTVEENTHHFHPEMYPIIEKLKTTRTLTPPEWERYMFWRQSKGTDCRTEYGEIFEKYHKKINCPTCKGLGYLDNPSPTHKCPTCDATGWNLKIRDLLN